MEEQIEVVINGVKYIPKPATLHLSARNKYEKALHIEFKTAEDLEMTVREYFRDLLLAIWDEEIYIKRPFGNSGWETILEETMTEAKVTSEKRVHAFISDLIRYMCGDPLADEVK